MTNIVYNNCNPLEWNAQQIVMYNPDYHRMCDMHHNLTLYFTTIYGVNRAVIAQLV
jgi:hypothetical protein